jgi:hypothetical protein
LGIARVVGRLSLVYGAAFVSKVIKSLEKLFNSLLAAFFGTGICWLHRIMITSLPDFS